MTRTADAQRREQLLDAIVDYVFENGLSELSLRPLAKAVGSSPRVLLYYFESKERLLHEILAGVRARQLAGFAVLRDSPAKEPREACLQVWEIMMRPQLLPMFRLFFEVFGLALQRPDEYREFLDHVIEDWVQFFAAPHIEAGVRKEDARAHGTMLLAGFRGFLMDVCATAERKRVDRALHRWLDAMDVARGQLYKEKNRAE